MINSKSLIFAIIAGLASALLAALALTRPGLLTLLIYVASVPIFIASFSWGTIAGIIAAGIASLSTGLAASIPIATVITVTTVGPAAYAGYLANLSRQDEDGNKYWFPISEVLFRLSIAVAASFIILGILFGYDVDTVAGQFEHFIRQVMATQNPQLSEAQESAIRTNSILYASLLPLIVPAFALAVLAWNMGIAERLARSRSAMQRPKDMIAADIGLPRMALYLFAGALTVALLVPSLQSIALVLTGVMGMALAMIGLAVMHYFTWGWKGRSQILFIAYVVTIVFSIPLILFLVTGIVELLMLLRARDPDRMTPASNT